MDVFRDAFRVGIECRFGRIGRSDLSQQLQERRVLSQFTRVRMRHDFHIKRAKHGGLQQAMSTPSFRSSLTSSSESAGC